MNLGICDSGLKPKEDFFAWWHVRDSQEALRDETCVKSPFAVSDAAHTNSAEGPDTLCSSAAAPRPAGSRYGLPLPGILANSCSHTEGRGGLQNPTALF